MKTSPSNKRISLFPSDVKPFSMEQLSDIISPMLKLGFLPQTKKALTIKLDKDEDKEAKKFIDTWGVDFIPENKDGIKISVEFDRIDLTTVSDKNWLDFKGECDPILEILKQFFPGGYARLALGYIKKETTSKDEAIEKGFVDEKKVKETNIRELLKQEVTLMEFDQDPEIRYNHVVTLTYSPTEDMCKLKTVYDINTLPEINKEIVTKNADSFLNAMVKYLYSI